MVKIHSIHSRIHQPRKRWIIENSVSLALALLIVFMIRSSLVEAFKIPSASMVPTLLIGDHIFVNKFAYGLKMPFSDLVSDDPVYIVKRSPPKRGDVIVFVYPKDESFYFIKRVIGLPGDIIELKNKVLYINQQKIQRSLVPDSRADAIFKSLDDAKYSPSSLDLYNERLDTSDHLILLDKINFIGETFGPIQVPQESLFVMGDNRDFSNDSRFWGFVPFRNVKGKAMITWLSLWVSLSDSQFIFRLKRIGSLIH